MRRAEPGPDDVARQVVQDRLRVVHWGPLRLKGALDLEQRHRGLVRLRSPADSDVRDRGQVIHDPVLGIEKPSHEKGFRLRIEGRILNCNLEGFNL